MSGDFGLMSGRVPPLDGMWHGSCYLSGYGPYRAWMARGWGMANRAILIVEDEPGIGEILEYALNDEPGYQATAVPNGASALAFLAEVRVDLILLDINMPGLDGFAIHDLIRARPGTASTPILFMTAADHTEEFVRRGVGTWLAKPFDIDDMLALVASVLDRGPAGDGVAPHGGQEGRDQGQ